MPREQPLLHVQLGYKSRLYMSHVHSDKKFTTGKLQLPPKQRDRAVGMVLVVSYPCLNRLFLFFCNQLDATLQANRANIRQAKNRQTHSDRRLGTHGLGDLTQWGLQIPQKTFTDSAKSWPDRLRWALTVRRWQTRDWRRVFFMMKASSSFTGDVQLPPKRKTNGGLLH